MIVSDCLRLTTVSGISRYMYSCCESQKLLGLRGTQDVGMSGPTSFPYHLDFFSSSIHLSSIGLIGSPNAVVISSSSKTRSEQIKRGLRRFENSEAGDGVKDGDHERGVN